MYNIPQVQLSYFSDLKATITPERITSSSQAYKYFLDIYEPGKLAHIEVFYMLLLNRNNKILGVHKVSEGGVAGTVVDPKIIFQSALLANASGIILCHNHPSGNLSPSSQDLDITRKIKEGGKILDISVNDHIIISPEGKYLSFADEYLM